MSALASCSTDPLLDFLKIRSIPQEALDLLRGKDVSTNAPGSLIRSFFLLERSCKFFQLIASFFLENGIDGSTLNLMKDDIDEFMAVIPKSGLRLLIKRVLKEEQGKQAVSKLKLFN